MTESTRFPSKVFVVKGGCYADQYLVGIYDTPQRAMGNIYQTPWTRLISGRRSGGKTTYSEEWYSEDGEYSMWAMDLTCDGSPNGPSKVVLRKPGGWVDHPITYEEADRLLSESSPIQTEDE